LRRLNTFESFKTPGFTPYFGSLVGNWCAMSMQTLVRSLLVYRLTGSAAIVGIIALANAIPTVIISLIGGAVADRLQKKYILLVSRAGLVIMTLGIAVSITTGYMSVENPGSWWVLMAGSAIEGVINGFMMPANMAIIPDIVSSERLMNAISLSTTGQNVFKLIGPALAGLLIDGYGFAAVYYLMTAMYVIATVFTAFLPLIRSKISSQKSAMADMVDGLRYIKQETVILFIVFFAIAHIIVGQPFLQLLPVFTESILKISASELGLLNSAMGVGALLGSLALASLHFGRRGLLLLLSGLVMGVPIVILANVHWWYLSMIMMFLIGMGPSIHGALTATLVQTYSQPEYRARMQGFVTMSQGLASVGTFIGGLLAELMGIQWAIGAMGLLLTLLTLIFMGSMKKLRSLE
jgi:MFS family permease